jgi:hypothetical protein
MARRTWGDKGGRGRGGEPLRGLERWRGRAATRAAWSTYEDRPSNTIGIFQASVLKKNSSMRQWAEMGLVRVGEA